MQKSQRSAFSSIRSEGALLPLDILQRIAQFDSSLGGLTAEAYHREGEKLNEVINEAWTHVLRAWHHFQSARAGLSSSELGTSLTRERWLLPLFAALDYGRLYTIKPFEVEGKTYPISHAWQHTPIHLVGCNVDLDHLARSSSTGLRSSPFSLVQEFLNRSGDYLWGMVSNGLQLRLLRKNVSITRQAYIEFDLETIFQGENYADFVLLWLLCHQSRVEGERPAECLLEKWSRIAQEQGFRALNKLRDGVEQAINILGGGFLAHPSNRTLRERLRSGELKTQDYYHQVLRMIYRLIVLFVAEDREVLFHPQADEDARQRYTNYYSSERLRRLAEQRIGTRHSDLFQGLRLVMDKLGSDNGCLELGLPPLNGFLFSHSAIPDLVGSELTNHDLLEAMRSLAFTFEGRIRHIVDYKNLGPEELGSVYESLLEMHPVINLEAHTFELTLASGNERKTSGSFYTPTSLIDCLLDSALEPVLAEARAKPNPEKAILNLKVCDPACGSGHFLIAAAHRIAKRLAGVRTGNEEPGSEDRRTALRDVVGHCIYGVDINPMAVELCKVNLWMEAIEPGKPLSFLDAHIQPGNSLLGATPTLLTKGIPDAAFEAIEGDNKKVCSEYKKRNNQQREGNRTLFDPEGQLWPWDRLGDFATSMMQLDEMRDDTVEDIHRKQDYYEQLVKSSGYEFGRLWADAWCAAFVWKKTNEFAYPITEEVFLNIAKNPHNTASWMKAEIIRLREQYQFFHWHLSFPDVFRVPTKDEEPENEQAKWSGGFDVVLGNPPWGKIKIQEKEWFASRRPDIANAASAAQRRRMIEALSLEDPALYSAFIEDRRQAEGESHFVHDSGRYPLCGRGDVNTYAIFAENMRLILNLSGRVGCIVQSGIATDDTTKFFFQDIVKKQSLVSFYDFENRKGIFPDVQGNMKFCLLTLSATPKPQALLAAQLDDPALLNDSSRRYTLSYEDIKKINPNTLNCPTFKTARDSHLIRGIYDRMSVFIEEGISERNSWGIQLSTMFHMTNDSSLFSTQEESISEGSELKGNVFYREEEKYLPLYESKLVDQFNHRAATFEAIAASERFKMHAGTNASTLSDLCNPNFIVIPRYWLPESEICSRTQIGTSWELGFRNAMSAVADSRSLVAAVIPYAGVGNSMPLLLLDGNAHKVCALLSGMNSFVLDYVLRQKASGGNLNFYVFKQLPFPDPAKFAKSSQWSSSTLTDWVVPRALELTYTAWDLEPFAKDCGYNVSPFRWNEERRFLLRCELDAAYFHLYGVEHNDVDYIMETFPIVKRRDENQYGEYLTKRVILEIYDEMRMAIEMDEAYRTRLDPPPADPAVAHEPREKTMFEGER